jgi:molybdenum cofactor synthesis domain-containing protein
MGHSFSVAILTISDRCSRGEMLDTSGPALGEIVRQEQLGDVVATACVPDEIEAIRDQLVAWSAALPVIDLILTTGGTGLAPRDVTPEATASVLERRHPALLELARLRCYPGTPRAFLSRGEAGARGGTLIINLPGSQRGCTECLRAMLDVLPHALEMLRGEVGHGSTHPPTAPG